MKKIKIAILLLVTCSASWGQNTFPSTGNVGIGTTSPNAKLSIKNAGSVDGVKLLELSEATSEEFLFKGYFLGTGAAGNKLILGTGVGGWQSNIMSWRGDGNVGIGTLSPTSKLSIRNVGATDGVRLLDFSESDGESFLFKGNFLGTGASGNSVIIGSNVSGYQSNIMAWRGDGNVGIGTVSPSARMHIYKDATGSQTLLTLEKYEGDINENSEINLDFVFTDANTNGTPQARISSEANSDTSKGVGMEAEGTADLKFWTANALNTTNNELVERMRITSTGKVGIGTTDFSGNHKLRVEGSIGAREIKVEASGWSDFVFKRDYDLRTLEEVEDHIVKKGHLPEIPSEKEVIENGINLGEMNAKLLQKIEELTLYLIEQNKEIKELKEKVDRLENK